MSRRARMSKAVVAAVAMSLPGCAGTSLFSKGDAAQNEAAALTQSNQAANNPSAFKKAGTAVADAFTIEPRVESEPDATSLASQPGKLGPEIFLAKARMHETQGDTAGAAQQYRKALEADPKNLTALVSFARLHDREQRFDRAGELYQRAVAAHPESAMVRNDLGLCHFRQGKTADAIASLERAVQLDPKKKLYRNNLAKALVQIGRTEDAWGHLSAVHEEHVAYYNLGYLLREADRPEEAAEQLRMALDLRPGFTEAAQMLARLEGAAEDADEAVATTETASPPSRYVATSPGRDSAAGPAAWSLSDDTIVQRTPSIDEEDEQETAASVADLQLPDSSPVANNDGEAAPTPDQFEYEFGAARVSHLPPVDSSSR